MPDRGGCPSSRVFLSLHASSDWLSVRSPRSPLACRSRSCPGMFPRRQPSPPAHFPVKTTLSECGDSPDRHFGGVDRVGRGGNPDVVIIPGRACGGSVAPVIEELLPYTKLSSLDLGITLYAFGSNRRCDIVPSDVSGPRSFSAGSTSKAQYSNRHRPCPSPLRRHDFRHRNKAAAWSRLHGSAFTNAEVLMDNFDCLPHGLRLRPADLLSRAPSQSQQRVPILATWQTFLSSPFLMVPIPSYFRYGSDLQKIIAEHGGGHQLRSPPPHSGHKSVPG